MKESRAILRRWRELRAAGEACALATVIGVDGSSYRRPGARMLIDACGQLTGSVSGGCLERDLARRGLHCLATGVSTVVMYDTTEDGDERERFASVGLGCSGVVRIWLERVGPEAEHPALRALERSLEAREATRLRLWATGSGAGGYGEARDADAFLFEETMAPPLPLLIVGAGHDVPPLVSLASTLGWDVTIADLRSALSLPSRYFQAADRFLRCDPSEVAMLATPESAILVMTHNYFHDLQILGDLLRRDPPLYIGLLGPRKRGEQMLSEITGARPETLARLHSPLGLDLGAETPAEIALAAVAEIQAARAGASASPLRDRSGPIHARGAA